MTPLLKVITEYCAVYVDDINLSDLAPIDMPLYARKMYFYLKAAIPLFTSPAEMQEYLLGTETNPQFTEPVFADTAFVTTENKHEDFVVALGQDYAGYDLCSCRMQSTAPNGTILMTPVPITYDKTTGDVTVHATNDFQVKAGTTLDFDLYTDGAFSNTLSPAIMNILGLCFQVVWINRFMTDWLSMVPKVEDKSFSEQNRANKENADTYRLESARRQLDQEMNKYEHNRYYSQIVTPANRIKL